MTPPAGSLDVHWLRSTTGLCDVAVFHRCRRCVASGPPLVPSLCVASSSAGSGPHPQHVQKEFYIGLWNLAQEYIKNKGKTLVQIYKCPLRYRFNCRSEIRIQEGPFGLVLEGLGSHYSESHLEPGEQGPIACFMKGKRLIQEANIPETCDIIQKLGQTPPKRKATRTAVT
jgi:hypothetical protein